MVFTPYIENTFLKSEQPSKAEFSYAVAVGNELSISTPSEVIYSKGG